MDGSASSKAEVMKPVLLKAGIPLALSVAAFVYARIMARRSVISEASEVENQVSSIKAESCEELGDADGDDGSYHSLNSVASAFEEVEEIVTSTHFMNSSGVAGYKDRLDYEQEILGIRLKVEELQKREWETRRELVHYHDLKEQESALMELRNVLLLEKAHVELLDRQISFMEAEHKRLENLVVEYLRVLEQLEYWKSESGLLQRKVKKLLRKTKEQSHVIREKNLMIEATEAEILRNSEELEIRSNTVKKLEDEVRELQEQKSELLSKLQSAEQSAPSTPMIEDEGMTMEDYRQLANEYEQLQKDRAAEVKELIYLRWTNACLRHELMRSNAQREQVSEKQNIGELQFEGCGERGHYGIEHHLGLDHGEPYFNVENGNNHASSKRPKLLQKLKRWVEGSEKMKSKIDEKERLDFMCFGRHSISDEPVEEHMILGRKSCSSA